MATEKFDFYDRTSLKSYNLDSSARYQLACLDSLDNYTRKHIIIQTKKEYKILLIALNSFNFFIKY